MAKFHTRLPRKEVEKYFYQMCLAVAQIKNPQEAAELLRDLLSYQEAEMIAKRLKIAELLLKNFTYAEIREKLKVSPPTIARVQEWLKISGGGYKQAVKNMKMKESKEYMKEYNPGSWFDIKKRYPAYFWPQLLLENIIENANYKEKKKLERVISQMEKMKEKNELFARLKRLVAKKGIYR